MKSPFSTFPEFLWFLALVLFEVVIFFLLPGLLQQHMVTIRQMAAGLTLLGGFVLSLHSIGGDETLETQATLPSEYPGKPM